MYPQDPNQPPPYGGQQWGGAAPAYSPASTTNTMAIVALVGSLVFAPLGIIFGHIARGQIRRTGEGGAGLALAGLIIGYVSVALAILALIFVVAFGAFVVSHEKDLYPSYTYTPSTEPSIFTTTIP